MPRDTKSKSSQNAATPAQTLAKLNGYMEAAGYAADHPWRLEIASTLNSPAKKAADDEVEAPKNPFVFTGGVHCVIEILDLEVDDRINLLTGQLAEILRVMSPDGYYPHIAHIIQTTAEMAAELAEKVRRGIDGLALADDIRELLYMIQDEKRTDHVHWLCQQIVEELVFIFAAKHAAESQQISDPE
jgi:hypothetical protein